MSSLIHKARSMRPHPVLTDPAILRVIFEHLIAAQDERDALVHARPQLLRLATCCKAFSEPALDLLWRKMDDILLLLKILPSFQKVDDAYMIRGVVNERDWSRFRRYATRIQELVHCPGDYLDSDRQFSAFVYLSIGRLCRREPLLPSLRKLHCFSTTEMLLFSTSALSHVKVEIKVSDEDQIVEQFLRMLIDKDPAMVDLAVVGHLSTGSLNALCGFTSLHSLTLHDTVSITIPVLKAIAAFPHLSKMEIDLRDMGPFRPSVWNPAAFPVLENLTVYGTLDWCDEILGALSTPILKSVCISVAERSYHMKSQTFAIGWYNYFQRLQSMSFNTLRRLQVGYVESVSLPDEPVHFFPKRKRRFTMQRLLRTRIIMHPLLRISGLESVKLTSWPSLPLSDQDVRDIALAWPKLVELCLPDPAVEKPSIASIPLLPFLNASLYLDHSESADFPPICTCAFCAWAGDITGEVAVMDKLTRSALATAKAINDLGRVSYPEGILSPKAELNVNAKDGKFIYDRNFLLQFMSICKEKPDMLPPLDAIGLEPVDQTYSMARGGSGRHRQSSNPPPSSSSRPAVGLGISGSSSGAFGKPAPFNMAMGNSSTMPTKLSSDATSNGARMASGPAGMQFGRAPPMVRSSGEGGPGGSGPTSGHRTRTKRKQKRDESTGLPGNEPECGGIGSPGGVGGLHEPKPLVHSWNRWVPTSIWKKGVAVDPNSPEVVDRKVRALLNKLTMEKFDSLSSQIVEWANKSEKEKNGRTLVQVIRLVFENATDQAMWSELYARLCREMMEQISPNVQDDGIKNAEGKPIASGQLFRKYLLNRCQEDFERGWVAKEVTAVAAVTNAIEDQAAAKDTIDKGEEVVLYSDKYYAAQKAKRQGLGLIKFIGELFKLQMLTERIMHECIKKLLGNVDDPEEEEIESLCVLLATVGAILDTNKARAHMDVYFSRMNQTVKSPNVRARLRFMLQDVIELRERKWVPRKIVAAPSTIAQVHEAAAKEKAAQEKEAHQRQMAMSHRGSRRDGECSRKTTQPGDLSHFGKAVKSTPTSFIPSGVFTDKKHSTKKEPSSSSPTSLNSSMFSMLSQNADGTVVEAGASEHAYSGRKGSVDITQSLSEPPKRKKVVLQPRPKPVKKPTAVPPPPPSDGNLDGKPPTLPPPPSMSEARARKKIAEDMKEFFGVRNLDEAEEYFTSLPIKHRFRLVDKLVATAIDSKETDAQLVADFFAQAIEKELCGPTIFEDGFTPTAEILDDLKYDTPKAFELMAIMMKGAGLDKDEERSKRIASKSTNSHKLLALLSS